MVFVAFVRAVMIGRDGLDRRVLLDMFRAAGAEDAASHISTGNVSFVARPVLLGEIVERVERDLESLLGRPTELFVRSLTALIDMLAEDPFARSPFDDPQDRIVTLFRDRVPARLELPIVADRGDYAVFAAGAREVFSVTRDVDGRRRAPGGMIERLAGQRVTSRSWSTIERIVAHRS